MTEAIASVAGVRPAIRNSILGLPVLGAVLAGGAILAAAPDHRGFLLAAFAVAVLAGLSATSTGVFGGVLVPGLLLLGVEPRLAAPMSLLLQVLVIPIGATSHYALGHVRRAITIPLTIGGVIGSVLGAVFASYVAGPTVALFVSALIIAVGLVVLVSLPTRYGSTTIDHEEFHPAQIGGIGLVAGTASGISGAGWGPIGVKLLILSRIEARHAIGSSLFGRIFMALAGVIAYLATALAHGGLRADAALFLVLLGGSVVAIAPGTYVISRLPRKRAAAFVAVLSILLALPTLIAGLK